MADPVRVLHVDDDPELADLTASFLEREDDRFVVETAANADEALAHLEAAEVDCVVSDYDMPGRDGIEFLVAVREEHPNLPFVLFTGKGSEEVASEAIRAGVTDYLQKEVGAEQYELLANRIRNAVEQYRATRRAATLDRVRDLASDVKQALIRAGSRSEIETRVCEIFSDAEPYLFAWIGDVDPDTGRVRVRESAGDGDGYLESITVTADESETGRGPTGTAVRERRVVVTQDIQSDPDFEPWREQALRHGFRSSAALPLVHGDTLYGELSLYADEAGTFDEEERQLLAELGDDIAHAIHSLETQAQLRREHNRRAVLFENDLNPVLEFTYVDDTPVVEATNAAFESVFGYESEEIVGQPVVEVTIPEDAREDHRRAISRVRAGERLESTVRRRTDSGIRHFVRRVIPYTIDAASEAIDQPADGGYAWYTDVTEVRERQRELERYETIVEALGDPVYALDAEGRFTFVNDAFVAEIGYPREDVIGEHVSTIVPEEQQERGRTVVRRLLADDQRRSATWELDRVSADGERVPAENHVALLPRDDGQFRGTAGVLRDITDRKKYEQRLEAITEATTKEAIYLKDLDGRYLLINQAGADVFGRDPEEVLGERAADLYDSVDRDRLAVDERVLETEEPIQYEVTRTVEGEEYHFSVEKRPYYEGGELFGLVGISRNITERKAYERELERQNERLDQFASVVAHDLRNPLNAAQGRLQLARKDSDSPHLDDVDRAHDRMEALITDLLTMAREGATVTDTEPVDLAELLSECWWGLGTDGARLVADTDATVEADPDRLRRLLENLLQNAVSHGGEDVTVTVGDLPDGFYVADDGPGIPEAVRERVFDLGYSASDAGTGFGLAIVDQIASAHDWAVDLSQSDAGGARFEVTGVDLVDA